jgi:hypothetical protein
MAPGDCSPDCRSGAVWYSSDFQLLAEQPGRGWVEVLDGRGTKRVPPTVRVYFSPDAESDRRWARELAAGHEPT